MSLHRIWQKTADSQWRAVKTVTPGDAETEAELLREYGRKHRVPGHVVLVLPVSEVPDGYHGPRPS